MSTPDVSPPTVRWRVLLALVARLPQPALSRAFGRIADVPIPRPLRRPILGAFARSTGIDIAEAELPLDAYPSLDAFFVRRLRPGSRRWPDHPGTAGSPVDGIVGESGIVHDGTALQAKGRRYRIAALLDSEHDAAPFHGGTFVTLYLSPRHYHRIHAPCDGGITHARHVPGRLLPVNAAAVAHIDELFPRNERIITHLDTPVGRLCLVAVGAYNVGRIATAFDLEWGRDGRVGNVRSVREHLRTYDPPVPVRAGDEVMSFHLGSTVIALFERGRVRLSDDLRAGRELRLGEVIARV